MAGPMIGEQNGYRYEICQHFVEVSGQRGALAIGGGER